MFINSLRILAVTVRSLKNQLLEVVQFNPLFATLTVTTVTLGVIIWPHFCQETSGYLRSLGLSGFATGTIFARFSWVTFGIGLLLPSLLFNFSIAENEMICSLPLRRSDIIKGYSLFLIIFSLFAVTTIFFQIISALTSVLDMALPQKSTIFFSYLFLFSSALLWGLTLNNILSRITRPYMSDFAGYSFRVSVIAIFVLCLVYFSFTNPFRGSFAPPVLVGQIFRKSYLHLPSIREQAALFANLLLAACSHSFSCRWHNLGIHRKHSTRKGRVIPVFTRTGFSTMVLLEGVGTLRDTGSIGLLTGISFVIMLGATVLFLIHASPPLKIFFSLSTQFCIPFLLTSMVFRSENRYSADLIHDTFPLSNSKREGARVFLNLIALSFIGLSLLFVTSTLAGMSLEKSEFLTLFSLIFLFASFSFLIGKVISGKNRPMIESLQIFLLGISISIPFFITFAIAPLPFFSQSISLILFSTLALLLSIEKEEVRNC